MQTIIEIIHVLKDVGIFGLAMWFIQRVLTKSAERKTEILKVELDQKTKEFQYTLDNKLETYKIDLAFINYKNSKIYERQLDAILELHNQIKHLNSEMVALSLYIAKSKFEDNEEIKNKIYEKLSHTIKTHDELQKNYINIQLFIPQKIVNLIDNILRNFADNIMNLMELNELDKDDILITISKIRKETKQAIDLLSFEFKNLLGVDKQINSVESIDEPTH